MGCSTSKSNSGDLGFGASISASRFLDKYTVGEILGRGSFGIVYACQPYGSDTACAVKMVDRVLTMQENIIREAELLQRMSHPNISSCLNVFYEKCFVCIVMERYNGGSLINAMRMHWKEKGMIPLRATSCIVAQMALPLNYLHQQQLVHRDVKGDNYLCRSPDLDDPSLHIVLTDFGTVCECPPGTRLEKPCGTQLYWSPEFYSRDYAKKVDVWALGVVLYGLLTGRFPFQDEYEVRHRSLKVGTDTPPNCLELLFGTLHRSEADRFASEKVIKHSFLQSQTGGDTVKAAANGSSTPEPQSGAMVVNCEVGAGSCIVERSQELVERLQDAHERVRISRISGRSSGRASIFSGSSLRGSAILDLHYLKPRFAVKAPRDQGMVMFEWWDPEKVARELGVKATGGYAGIVNVDGTAVLAQDLGKMLTDHGVDITKLGEGNSNTLLDLASEVHSGATVMMLDAASHKKVVRVINVVCLRIRSARGANKYLIEVEETLVDGCKATVARLPQKKKEPHENSRQTAEKILKENLESMGKLQVNFDWRVKEIYEEEVESPSYPGLRTLYRKEIVEGFVCGRDSARSSRNSSIRVSFGSSQFSSLLGSLKTGPVQVEVEDSTHNRTTHKWMRESECLHRGVKLKAPEEGMEVCGLVNAPLGMNKQSLEEKLKSHDINIAKFGQDADRALAELAAEFVRGESILSTDKKGAPIRIVDVVVLNICHPDGRILVEVEHLGRDGTRNVLNRLPGAKRRPDENLFHTAWRVLKRNVKMEEDYVMIKNQDVVVQQEETTSKAYPALRTMYRKRIVPVNLMSNCASTTLTTGVTADCVNPTNPVILGSEQLGGHKQRESQFSTLSLREGDESTGLAGTIS